MYATRSSNVGVMLGLAMFLIAGVLAFAMLGSAANVAVTTNSHAALKHSTDAYRARLAVFNCDPRYLQVFVSDGHSPKSHGKWLFVCPNTSATLCAGMIVGTTPLNTGSYPELTSFVSTCQHWTVDVPARDGYVSAPAKLITDAWMVILTLKEEKEENNAVD